MTIAAYFVELKEEVDSGAGCCMTRSVVHALTASDRTTTSAACQAASGRRRAETCKELPEIQNRRRPTMARDPAPREQNS